MPNANPLKRSIHRLLIRRVALATLAISAVFTIIAYVTGRDRLEEEVLDVARIEVSRFNTDARDVLDTGGLADREGVQAALDRYSEPDIHRAEGRWVLVVIYNREGVEVARSVDDAYELKNDAESLMGSAERARDDIAHEWLRTRRIGGRPHIHASLPLYNRASGNSASEVVGRIEGVFAVSEEAVADIRGGIVRTILYVIAIVLATAMLIYPVISSLIGRLARTTVSLLDSNLETLAVLGGAIAKRDSDTDAHNYRVAVYSVRLAEQMGVAGLSLQSLIKGAFLHDVGKIGVRDKVLLKPGKLTDDEYEVMKTHVDHGLDITSQSGWLGDARDIVGAHHEKFGGDGYPRGIRGNDIPMSARIFAIVDVFDALTSRRPYKEPFSFDETMEIMENGRGSHFDPNLLDAFGRIARSLYDEFAGADDDKPKKELDAITERYFKEDVRALLS